MKLTCNFFQKGDNTILKGVYNGKRPKIVSYIHLIINISYVCFPKKVVIFNLGL